jgi:hypothetical protein
MSCITEEQRARISANYEAAMRKRAEREQQNQLQPHATSTLANVAPSMR